MSSGFNVVLKFLTENLPKDSNKRHVVLKQVDSNSYTIKISDSVVRNSGFLRTYTALHGGQDSNWAGNVLDIADRLMESGYTDRVYDETRFISKSGAELRIFN